ncbi:hypothetical protein [Streptosporangium saharense]|uniref:Secreted protein n=1 Tax=Streptosporangium saharense TaxID=1706840 RepID=A0A7W7QHQ6_9ACTN|nr:hypothetical protein [Streptosporangium saharense]MBB4913805.1 hypothetical protein [Streptosporangium saharense]
MSLIKRLAVTAAATMLAVPLAAAPATAVATRTYVCAQGGWVDWYPFQVMSLEGQGCTGPDGLGGPGVITVSSWGKTYSCESVLWASTKASAIGFRCVLA